MLNIAYFSPLPPQRTGIADYSADLLPHLAKLANITLFVDDVEAASPALRNAFEVQSITRFPGKRLQFDTAIYQMGNSLFHREMFAMFKRYPGFLVLHDYVLHHLIASTTVGGGNFPAYVRELAYAESFDGVNHAYRIRAGTSTPLFDQPLNARLVDLSLGVLVHSYYVHQKLSAVHSSIPICKVNQPMIAPELPTRKVLRERLGISPNTFVLITCGAIIPERRMDLLLDAFATFHTAHPDSLWLMTGSLSNAQVFWLERVKALDLERAVRVSGYVDGLDNLYNTLGASDVCVSLRYPTAGETSASTLRAMAAALPLIVSDVGWYAELPDDCCLKVSHPENVTEQLTALLEKLYTDRELCIGLGQRARAYIEQEYNPMRVVSTYITFVEKVLSDMEKGYDRLARD